MESSKLKLNFEKITFKTLEKTKINFQGGINLENTFRSLFCLEKLPFFVHSMPTLNVENSVFQFSNYSLPIQQL